MNSSIEVARQNQIKNLQSDFLEIGPNCILMNESEINCHYLDSSDIDDSLLEHYYAAEAKTSHYKGSLESFQAQTDRLSPSVSQSSRFEQLVNDEKSLVVNCKTFCKDLMKPIANKITKIIIKKRTNQKSNAKLLQSFSMQSQHPKIKLKSQNVQFKMVPSVQQAHLNINSAELIRSANDRFSNLADIIYYNI